MTIRIGVIGVAGRMGGELVKVIVAAPDLQLGAALEFIGSAAVGQDAAVVAGLPPCGVHVTADLPSALRQVDVAIDFSRASSVAATAQACGAAGVPLMVGTTGLDKPALRALDAAAQRTAVLVSANTSLALNVLLELVQRAARALPADYDVEVFEAHHRHKVDAPSGTALALGDAAAAGRGVQLSRPVQLTGAASGARATGTIGFSVVRGGDVVGEHDVRLLGAGEQLRLSHVATDRAVFARGAVAAASWLVGRPPGRYHMADFLFQKQ